MIDTIAIKESFGLGHAPGVVAVLGAFPVESPEQYVGKTACIATLSGGSFEARIEAVRDHGETISLYFRGLTPDDIPIGSRIDLEG